MKVGRGLFGELLCGHKGVTLQLFSGPVTFILESTGFSFGGEMSQA